MRGLRIGETSELTGLTIDTLRYYERVGAIPPIERDAQGRRSFNETDVAWAQYAHCLRSLGMPVAEIAEYVDAATDPHSQDRQMALLRVHLDRMRQERNILDAYIRTGEAKLAAFGQPEK